RHLRVPAGGFPGGRAAPRAGPVRAGRRPRPPDPRAGAAPLPPNGQSTDRPGRGPAPDRLASLPSSRYRPTTLSPYRPASLPPRRPRPIPAQSPVEEVRRGPERPDPVRVGQERVHLIREDELLDLHAALAQRLDERDGL